VAVRSDHQIEQASSGSATKRGVRTVPPRSNTTIVLSLAGQSDARSDTEPAAAGKPEPARERDDTIGQKRFRAAVKRGGHSPVSSAESPTRAVYRSILSAALIAMSVEKGLWSLESGALTTARRAWSDSRSVTMSMCKPAETETVRGARNERGPCG